MSGIFGQSLVRVRAGQRTTRAGDVVTDWSPDAVTRVVISGLSVQPNTQAEVVNEGGDVRVTGYRVITEPGNVPDVTALDRLEYRGIVHAVSGEVAFWPDPHGMDHLEFTITEWRGA